MERKKFRMNEMNLAFEFVPYSLSPLFFLIHFDLIVFRSQENGEFTSLNQSFQIALSFSDVFLFNALDVVVDYDDWWCFLDVIASSIEIIQSDFFLLSFYLLLIFLFWFGCVLFVPKLSNSSSAQIHLLETSFSLSSPISFSLSIRCIFTIVLVRFTRRESVRDRCQWCETMFRQITCIKFSRSVMWDGRCYCCHCIEWIRWCCLAWSIRIGCRLTGSSSNQLSSIGQ